MQKSDVQKKILYKAKYRGTLEGNQLLQGFSAHFVPNASDTELNLLLEFLELTDQNILYMVRYQQCPHPKFQDIVDKLIKYTDSLIK